MYGSCMPYLSITRNAFYKKWLSWLVLQVADSFHRGLPAAQTFELVGVLAENLPDIGRI